MVSHSTHESLFIGLRKFLVLLNEPLQLLALLRKLAGGLCRGGLLDALLPILGVLGANLRIDVCVK